MSFNDTCETTEHPRSVLTHRHRSEVAVVLLMVSPNVFSSHKIVCMFVSLYVSLTFYWRPSYGPMSNLQLICIGSGNGFASKIICFRSHILVNGNSDNIASEQENCRSTDANILTHDLWRGVLTIRNRDIYNNTSGEPHIYMDVYIYSDEHVKPKCILDITPLWRRYSHRHWTPWCPYCTDI